MIPNRCFMFCVLSMMLLCWAVTYASSIRVAEVQDSILTETKSPTLNCSFGKTTTVFVALFRSTDRLIFSMFFQLRPLGFSLFFVRFLFARAFAACQQFLEAFFF